MSDATCKTCPFWWYRVEDGHLRETACRRYPRRVVPVACGGAGQPVDPTWDVWPSAQPDDWCGEHPLRQHDRLAAMAMQGMLAAERIAPDNMLLTWVDLARDAYAIADAMLAARASPRSDPGEGR